jgi:hypothetical protein
MLGKDEVLARKYYSSPIGGELILGQVNVKNILVGYGDLYWADYGTELPDLTSDPNAIKLQEYFNADANWNYLGATQEGVELAYEPDYGEVEIDQLRDAAILFNQMVTVNMNTTLAEATLENLLIAWGVADEYLQQAGDGKVSSFSIGVPGEEPIERAVAVIGKGGVATYQVGEGESVETVTAKRDRLYHGRRVLSVEGSTLSLSRTENTAFPVTFRLLPDPGFPDSEYGVILDRIPGDSTENPNPNNVFSN